MLAPAECTPNVRPSPLPSALLAAELGPAVMADDPCEAAFSAADPTGPRNYHRARYFDPKIGRFISEDPIGFSGGINFYTYAENRPVDYTDLFGLAVDSVSNAIKSGNVDAMKALLDNPGLTAQSRQAIQQALQRLQTPVRDLIRGRLKNSPSYSSEYENMTLEALKNLARTNKDAARMVKLIKEEKRLRDKLRGLIVALCGGEEEEP